MSRSYSSVIIALIVALLGSAVLWSRVSVAFAPKRVKVVDAVAVSPVDSAVVVHTGGRALPAAPLALVARVRNDERASLTVSISVQSHPVCQVLVPAGTTRIDCAIDVLGGDVQQVELKAGSAGWQLQYLEMSSHHGATRGHDLVILPRGSRSYVGPEALDIAMAFVLLFAVFMLPQPRLGKVWRTLYLLLAGLVWAVAGIIAVSPLLSPFLVIVSAGMFWQCAALLALPRLGWGLLWCLRRRDAPWRTAVQCIAIVVMLACTFGAVSSRLINEHYGGNYSGFLRLSKARVDHNPTLNANAEVKRQLLVSDDHGYDAQYAYFIAFDPFIRQLAAAPEGYSAFIDAPSYRFGRIGFSLLTRLIAADRLSAFPTVMVWLVLLGVVGSAMGLMSVLVFHGGNRAITLLVVAIPAFWQSVQVALPEPLAAAFLLAGYACYIRGRRGWAVVAFAASLLVRETGVVFLLCLAVAEFRTGRRRSALMFALASAAPLALWRLYVGLMLVPALGFDAFWHATGDFTVPLGGFVDLWSHIARGEYFPRDEAFARAGVWYPALLIVGLGLATWLVKQCPGPLASAAAIYGVVAVSLTYGKIWEHIGNGQRGTYELFLMLALISAAVPGTLPSKVRAALIAFWTATAGYVFLGTFDAEFVRDSIAQAIVSMLF